MTTQIKMLKCYIELAIVLLLYSIWNRRNGVSAASIDVQQQMILDTHSPYSNSVSNWLQLREKRAITNYDQLINASLMAQYDLNAGKKELFFGVLLPPTLPDRCNSLAVLPAMDLAINKVQALGGILEGFNITMEYRDTQCSSTYGPLAAFELYTKRKPGRRLFISKFFFGHTH